jgi:Mn2+/Fe2+ NRAMP family transporter
VPDRAEGAAKPRSLLPFVASIGPGILVMLADTDAGNVVTAAQSGARWGYRLLPLLLGLIPVLYMVQELAVRLGIFTGRGYSELVRCHFGRGWAWVSVAGLAVAVAGSMFTEFAAVAGIGELYGISRNLTLPLAASTLLVIVFSGSYRRVERAAILIGSFELAFLLVAATTHPDFATVAHDVVDIPFGNTDFWFLGAALIGAVFNPWMVFYQQSATVEKKLGHRHYSAARADTALGAVLTQLVSASVLFGAASTFGTGYQQASLGSVGQISEALTPHLGATVGRLVFSLGVLGASIVAAIVCSLALSWALGEAAGYRRAPDAQPFRAPWFYAVYAVCVLVGAALAWTIPNLIWLTITAQIVNVFLLPMVLAFLVVLATSSLSGPRRLRGWYLSLVVIAATATCACAMLGAIHGIL